MSKNERTSHAPRRGPGGGGHGPMMMGGEKAQNFKGTMAKLLKLLKPSRIGLIAVVIFAILSTVFTIVGPKIAGRATTSIQTTIIQKMFYSQVKENMPAGFVFPEGMTGKDLLQKMPKEQLQKIPESMIKSIESMDMTKKPAMDFGYIGQIIMACLALYAVSALFSFVQSFIMAGITQRLVFKMRSDVSDKLGRLPMKYFDQNTHGEILSRVTNDIDNISNTLQQAMTQMITSVATLIGIFIMMLTISVWLTLITLVTLPLAMIVTIMIAKHSQKQFAANQKELGNINGHVEEMYAGHKIVRAFGREQTAIDEFDTINKRLYTAGFKSQFISGIIMPVINMVNNIGYVLVCVVGGLLATKGTLVLGDVQAFITYSRQFTMPIVQVANIVNILQSTAASAERVFELLEEKEEVADAADAMEIEAPRGDIVFKDVQFGYSDDKILINDMNINVKKGQTVAIVGPTGAGKTTLVNLLMRFYEIQDGQILIDGKNITDIKRSSLRDMFGMVLQDTWLFKGTIKDNIAYGREGATFDEIVVAADAAYADRFIRTLTDGYETVLNEDASNISQGQKQLLTIARAVLADPAIMILDEATSSVDTRTELLIQKAMGKLMKGRTSFVVAHRLSTIKNADMILVMNHGDIIEQGTHKELLDAKGFYADLYNSQFAGPKEQESA